MFLARAKATSSYVVYPLLEDVVSIPLNFFAIFQRSASSRALVAGIQPRLSRRNSPGARYLNVPSNPLTPLDI